MTDPSSGYPPVRYTADSPRTDASLRPSAAPPDLVTDTTEIGYLATKLSTSGEFGLYHYLMTGAPSGPGPHFHRTISESFYILSGEVRLYDGLAWVTGVVGDFFYVPAGSVHAFRNESGRRAEMLLLFAPGAPREAYFETNVRHAREGVDLQGRALQDYLRSHDQYTA